VGVLVGEGADGKGVAYSWRGLSTFSAPPVFSLEVLIPLVFSLDVVDDILMTPGCFRSFC